MIACTMEINRLRIGSWLIDIGTRVGLVLRSEERSFFNCRKAAGYIESRRETDAKHQWRIIMSKMML